MNPRSIRIAGHMVLTSLTRYVTDVLLRTNNSVAGAMLLMLGTLVIQFTVNSDCTGTMKIDYTAGGAVPAGVETDLNIVVAADGTLIESVVYRAVTVSGTSGDGMVTCPQFCEQAVQESFEGKKVVVYGFR